MIYQDISLYLYKSSVLHLPIKINLYLLWFLLLLDYTNSFLVVNAIFYKHENSKIEAK